MPPVTQFLVIANVVMFLLTQMAGPAIIQWFALWPLGSGLFMPWQLASYGFLHAGLTHLMFLGWPVRPAGRLCDRVPAAQDHPADSTDPDAGLAVRHALRRG
jgi:membrane associated rhomboid family serine protease